MDLLPQFEKTVKAFHLQSAEVKVIAAVSGGVDSVVLAELCRRSGLRFAIAHCNFQLRGPESERDEQFVTELAAKYAVDLFVKKFDTEAFATTNKLSIQEAARKLRYDFFQQVLAENNFSYTLLAHHADDQVETMLMNFFRGTGLEGLTGMPSLNMEQAKSLRPMLHMRREGIVAFARENNLAWVEDSSNDSNKYTRNFFRNTLLPQLQEVFPQVKENVLHNIERMQATNDLYKMLVDNFIKKIGVQKGEELHIPVLKLLPLQHTSLLYELIRNYGFGEKQVNEVVKLLDATSGKFIRSDTHQIIRHRRWIIIAPLHSTASTVTIDAGEQTVNCSGGMMALQVKKGPDIQLLKQSHIAQLDAKRIEFPLVLRRWKQGDYFYPLGMKKKKKVARFFIDQKLSKSDKENVWVLESKNRIVWIVSHRIDDRFKITDKTQQVLQITWSNL